MLIQVESGDEQDVIQSLFAVRGLIAQTVTEDIINNLDAYSGGSGQSETEVKPTFDDRNGNLVLYEAQNDSLDT